MNAVDELRVMHARRIASAAPPAALNRFGDRGDGAIDTGEVAIGVAGQCAAHLMVKVIGPYSGEAETIGGFGPEYGGQVSRIFRDEVNAAAEFSRRFEHGGVEICKYVARAIVLNGVGGVEPQAVEVIFVNPAQGVFYNVVTYGFAQCVVVVDAVAPWRAMVLGEIVAAKVALV